MPNDSSQHAPRIRYEALDGLRGVAALVVVLHHGLLVSPELATASYAGGAGSPDSWVWWATFTPLHLAWAGKEAVYIFFVLSGFVLALPFVGASQPRWTTYFWKRLLRIYPPVWASLVFAAGSVWLVPRVTSPDFSPWINLHDERARMLTDALLLWGAGSLNSPLWSLQWEMAFSLLLPLYVVFVNRPRRSWLPAMAALVLLICLFELIHLTEAAYLLMFAVGALMAASSETLRKWGTGLHRCRQWAAVIGASLILLCSRWIIPTPVPVGLAVTGAALLVFVCIAWKPAVGLRQNLFAHWLGLRSFSLYLVHEPIIVSVALGLRTSDALSVCFVAIPLSFLASEVFFRLVERPSHHLSRAVGKAWDERMRHREQKLTQRP